MRYSDPLSNNLMPSVMEEVAVAKAATKRGPSHRLRRLRRASLKKE